MLSLIACEMTLFFGLLLSFLESDQACHTGCLVPASQLEMTRGIVSVIVVLVNVLFLVYFMLGLSYHVYFLLPRWCKCQCCHRCHKNVSKTPGLGYIYTAALPNHHQSY